jgi:hypothetical protein
MNKISEFESTDARNRGGATRSSIDGTVMVAVVKGLRWICQNSDQPLFDGRSL